MRIAFLLGTFPAQSLTFLDNQIRGLSEAGHDVSVFGHAPSPETPQPPYFSTTYIDTVNLLNFPRQRGAQVLKGLSAACRSLWHSTRSAPFLIQSVSLQNEAPRHLCHLKQWLAADTEKYDILHAHFGHVARQWTFLGNITQQPFIATFYGADVTSKVHPNNYNYYNTLWDKLDLAIGLSQHIRSRLIMLGCPERKSVRLPLGVKLDRFPYCEPRDLANEPIRVATVARATEKKGLTYAIQAMKILTTEGVEFEYRIAGDGPLRDHLESKVSDYNLEDRITFLGWQSQSEVHSLLCSSDVFLLPSVTAANGDMEGQALVIQEAQATGLPVVTTYHNGIPEGVRPERTGVLVPERDPQAIAEALCTFATNERHLASFSRAARAFVEEEYSLKDVIDRQVAIYRQLES